MAETVLKVDGLYKKFSRSLKRNMFYGTVDLMRGMIGARISNDLRKSEFWALQDINFTLKRGEKIGFLGENGSGKTTLLRLINGIYPPDAGKITISGRIGALISVGAGFHPHMSGRENIYLNGTILGMSRGEINRKINDILEFAEIGEFIDAPVATYSSGMTVRLGFSIAIHGNVDILLVDEILAVGDLAFQLKCQKKLSEFRQNDGTFIIVAHNMQVIRNTCERVFWLDKGKIISEGDVFEICNNYENFSLSTHKLNAQEVKNKVLNYDISTKLTVNLLNSNQTECDSILCGEMLIVRINYNFLRKVHVPIFTISALNEEGKVMFESYSDTELIDLFGVGIIDFVIPRFSVKPQLYHISVTLSEIELLNKLEWHNNLYNILILGNNEIKINQGLTFLYPQWQNKKTIATIK